MILVTGAGGQLGTALTFLLEKQGQKYEALGRGDLDITNFARVVESTKVLKPRLVINCAAYNDVDAAETHWQDASNVNGLGVRNLAVACAECKVPLVHVSTDFVFDGTKSEPYTIADKPHPINAYGKSKLFGETLLRSLTDRYYLVRTSWVFGRGTNNFMTKLFSWAANNDTLRIIDDQVSAPTAAIDLARALLALAVTGAYGLYHFHNLGQCSKFQWAEYALRKTGWKGKLEPVCSSFFDTVAERPSYSVLDLFPISDRGFEIPTWEEATSKWLEQNK